jgi:hypothetical protein
MGQQLLETAVFRKQGFRLGDHGEKSPAADDDQLFSVSGSGPFERAGRSVSGLLEHLQEIHWIPASDFPLQFQYFNQPFFTHLPEKFQYHPTPFSESVSPKAGADNFNIWEIAANKGHVEGTARSMPPLTCNARHHKTGLRSDVLSLILQ